MKNLVENIVKSLVDVPDLVTVTETIVDASATLEIRVSPDDVGKVIGKEGRIANALRTVAKAAAAKSNRRVTVEIMAIEKELPSK